jgi:hypothetical protein
VFRHSTPRPRLGCAWCALGAGLGPRLGQPRRWSWLRLGQPMQWLGPHMGWTWASPLLVLVQPGFGDLILLILFLKKIIIIYLIIFITYFNYCFINFSLDYIYILI